MRDGLPVGSRGERIVSMATQVCRVAVLGIGWAKVGDWRFVAVALTVLALLGVSIALGLG